jgi:hypothetical protein
MPSVVHDAPTSLPRKTWCPHNAHQHFPSTCHQYTALTPLSLPICDRWCDNPRATAELLYSLALVMTQFERQLDDAVD